MHDTNRSRRRTAVAAVLTTALLLPLFAHSANAAETAQPRSGSEAVSPASRLPEPAAARDSVTFERSASGPAAADVNFDLQVVNNTGVSFDEVVVVVGRQSDPQNPEFASRIGFNNGETEIFSFLNCEDVTAYAVGIFDNNELIFNTGDIEPVPGRCAEAVVFQPE